MRAVSNKLGKDPSLTCCTSLKILLFFIYIYIYVLFSDYVTITEKQLSEIIVWLLASLGESSFSCQDLIACQNILLTAAGSSC